MDPIFFYREREYPYGCFSNWYPAKFTDENGTTFHNTEQYMMYQKALVFNDKETASAILKNSSPRLVKGLGRKVKNFDGSTWNRVRMEIVERGNFFKFTQNPELKQTILSTGKRQLVEASPVDNIWGIGLSAADARKVAPSEWPGENLLGKALVSVREKMRLNVVE